MSGSVWGRRRARALQLLRDAPHAEELLVFYAELTEIQEWVAERVPVDAWLRVGHSDEEGGPLLRVERLDPEELMPLFRSFLQRLADAGTDVIRAGTRVLLASPAEARAALLADPTAFHAHTFLEAVMTTLAASRSQAPDGPPTGDGRVPEHCPACGSLPVVGVLRDVPDAQGARTLTCSLCATEWRTSRLSCAHCGESSADKLLVHTAESVPHVRVDECASCQRYLKTVDLRKRGDAIPVVDELAAVELDLWAQEKGLTKIQTNVLEL